MTSSMRWGFGATLAALLCGPASVAVAQTRAPADSATVTPGPQFRAGGLHTLFFGSRYRSLWTTPIRVPVLDLHTYAGGLKPTKHGGGTQTKSLRFVGGDGREYAFRSVAKDPVGMLPLELRETLAADLLRDQMSSGHPAGPVVVAPLLEAAGVLHASPILVKMPDDPALGEYRAEFAGMLGTIEERPRELADEGASFAGASKIVGSDELYQELDKDPAVRVDARAFLLARLTDVFLGDWDRHRDQWRWALVGNGAERRWLPIPRDRDQAFVRFDGFLLAQARRTAPQLLNFGPSYGSVVGATWNGRDLDRRFLSGLERPVWDSVAAVLKSRLTDPVIAASVRRLPPEFYPLDGARLESALKNRRDRLDQIAVKYYRLLAAEADIWGTDRADDATVTRQPDGNTEVVLAHNGAEYFRRRFHPGETQDIRIYLQGGNDRVTVGGTGRGSPTVRAIGGGGDDSYAVSRSGGVRLYDDRGTNTASGAGINTKRWSWKPDSANPRALPPRDWGRRTMLFGSALYGPDVQVVLGYSGHTDWFAFRKVPYATRLSYGLEYSTGKSSFRGKLGLTHQFENSGGFWEVDALVSGIETIRFYGFGNGTLQDPTKSPAFYRVNQTQIIGGLSLGTRFGPKGNHRLAIGPTVRWSDTDLSDQFNQNRFIAVVRPYGVGRFGMVGMRANFTVEGRDHPNFASRGAALRLNATGYGGVWDAAKPLARLDAEGSFALSPSGSWRPTLNLMAGAVKTFGKLPFFVAPTLGGLHTLRGYRPDRFVGEDATYGSAELRLPVSRFKIVVPGEQGIFGFGDVGRVFVTGETFDQWHSTLGGGVWLSFLGRGNLIFAGFGKPTTGTEGGRAIVGLGFPY